MKIFKYELHDDMTNVQTVMMPKDAHILSVQWQSAAPLRPGFRIWALVDENEREFIGRRFVILGTGWDVPTDVQLWFLATVQVGRFVWHVFEEKTK